MDDRHDLDCWLTPAQRRLFDRMSPRDQWHAVQTWRLLERAGERDEALRTAALLHDAGKGYVRLHERILYVMLAGHPRLLRAFTSRRARGLRGTMFRLSNHAEIGARLAAEAGTTDVATDLIRRHHDAARNDIRLELLVRADEQA